MTHIAANDESADHDTPGRHRAASRSAARRSRWPAENVALILLTVGAMVVPSGSWSALAQPPAPAAALAAVTTCPAAGCSVTVDARDFAAPQPQLAQFNYVINVDNTKLPGDPTALSTESNSPIVRVGDQTRPTVNLPDGRYLISVRAGPQDVGQHITLPNRPPRTGR